MDCNSPIRMVIDSILKLPKELKIFNDNIPTIVFNYKQESKNGHIQFIRLLQSKSVLLQIMDYCCANNIISILVEGGSHLLQSFIDEGVWDEARIITNTSLTLGNGLNAPVLQSALMYKEETIINDQIIYYKNEHH